MLSPELVRSTPDTVTVRIDFTVRRRGGKKLIIVPDGEPGWAPPRARIDNALVKAVARAFRWRKLLETGVYSTLAELAASEKINPSYVSRVLRLTLLAPDIVEAILNGRQPPALSLASAMRPFSVEWAGQRETLLGEHCSRGASDTKALYS
jgi:hypothetical protein